MPEMNQVRWTKGTTTSGQYDDPGMTFIQFITGSWNGYFCNIIPMHQHRMLFRASIHRGPGKECPQT